MRYTESLLTGEKPVAKTTARIAKPKQASIPQDRKLDSRQVKNNAGGYVYEVNSWQRLKRFLILGTEGGSYYVGQQKMTQENCKNVLGCINADGIRVVNTILEISVRGTAPKQDSGIFVLALCMAFGNVETKRYASSQVDSICRTASTLFQWVEELKTFRSLSGRTVRRALQNWYQSKTVDQLAYQMVKYQHRNNWRHGDLIRVCHPVGKTEEQRDALYSWAITGEWKGRSTMPEIIEGAQALKKATSAQAVANIVRTYKLPWETVPTEYRKSAVVWEALMEGGSLPMTAMIRNLGNMTACGYLNNTGEGTKLVNAALHDSSALKKARIHPLNVLIAMKTYEQGHGFKGSNTWSTIPSIVASLDDCFYESFQHCLPTGKRFMLGIDVSGSMSWASSRTANGMLMSSEAAAALAMYWVRTEETAVTLGFAGEMKNLGINRRDSLTSAVQKTASATAGRTDAALPILWALNHRENFDVFVTLTDNDTYAGSIHPKEALRRYRDQVNPDAALVVAAFTASKFSIADPNDPRSLDVVGFDSSIPEVVSALVKS